MNAHFSIHPWSGVLSALCLPPCTEDTALQSWRPQEPINLGSKGGTISDCHFLQYRVYLISDLWVIL